MPTNEITVTKSPNRYAGNSKVLTTEAADAANSNHFAFPDNGELVLFVHNTGGSARTITIASQADANTGRKADITALSMAAGERRVFRFAAAGWRDSNGQLVVTGSHADLVMGAIDLSDEVLT